MIKPAPSIKGEKVVNIMVYFSYRIHHLYDNL